MSGKHQNNPNPRKFKEKIELLKQKEAQLTANFMEVMQGIPLLTRSSAPYSKLASKESALADNTSPSLTPSLKPCGQYTRESDNSGDKSVPRSNASTPPSCTVHDSDAGSNVPPAGIRGDGVITPNPSLANTLYNPPNSDPLPSSRRRSSTKVTTIPRPRGPRFSPYGVGGVGDVVNRGRMSNVSSCGETEGGVHVAASASSPYQPNLGSVSLVPNCVALCTNSVATSAVPTYPPSTAAAAKTTMGIVKATASATSATPSRSHTHFRGTSHAPPPPPSSSSSSSQSAWGLPTAVDGSCDFSTGPREFNDAIFGGMSLIDYRRTVSDSCIPSTLCNPEQRSTLFPRLHTTQQAQQPRRQPPPPPQQFHKGSLPPVNEFTFQHYNNPELRLSPSACAYPSDHNLRYFDGGGSSSSSCYHHYHQPVSTSPLPGLSDSSPSLQLRASDYQRARNTSSNSYRLPLPPLKTPHLAARDLSTPYTLESNMPAQQYFERPCLPDWTPPNGINGGRATSQSARDLPGACVHLKRSDSYTPFRKQLLSVDEPLAFPPRTASLSFGESNAQFIYSNHHHSAQYAKRRLTAPPTAHPFQAPQEFRQVTSDLCAYPHQMEPPLPNPSPLDCFRVTMTEQEGRRESFSMTVDLLSRLERPSNASTPTTVAAAAYPSVAAVTSCCGALGVTPKGTRVDLQTKASGTPFYVPIAANDFQILTEPSLVNYVTDKVTEEQLVRELCSPPFGPCK